MLSGYKKPLLSIFFLLLCNCSSATICKAKSPDEKIFHFIYVDANTGASSGGHSALVFDGTVFHFQNQPDGFFKFEKTGFGEFYKRYSELENRSIYMHDIAVSKKSFTRIYKKLLQTWLIQEKNFYLYEASSAEIDFYHSLLHDKGVVKVAGADFFDYDQPLDSPLPAGLSDFTVHLVEYSRQLRIILDQPDFKTTDQIPILDTGRYPPSIQYPGNQYIDQLQARIAIQSLIQGWRLHYSAYYQTGKILKKNTKEMQIFLLNEKEILLLKNYKDELIRNIKELVVSKRPGHGIGLLLAVARLQTVQMSIEQKILIVLDPFPNRVIRLDQGELANNPELSRHYTKRLFNRFEQVKDYTFSKNDLHESQWNGFENTAGFFLELMQSKITGRPTRILPDRMIPGRKAELYLTKFVSAKTVYKLKKQASRNLEAATRRRTRLVRELNRVYSYNIFSQNCVTELVGLVNNSFPDIKLASKGLGGEIKKNTNLLFIPFVSFDIVADNWRVVASRKFIPRRLSDLEKNKQGLSFLGRTKEAFVFTSSSYTPITDDNAFAFFTDDQFLLRPILGIGNMIYTTGHSLAGLMIAPFDGGTQLKRGGLGFFWSLPELAFFNVRKGSYQITSGRDPATKNICEADSRQSGKE